MKEKGPFWEDFPLESSFRRLILYYSLYQSILRSRMQIRVQKYLHCSQESECRPDLRFLWAWKRI